MDWPRFWGQFSETIDKTNVAAITKFSYLRELLDSKVRRTIEALPFTPEGYNRAKSILTEKYGKESEIVKAYTREIVELPSIPNSNQKKITEFSEKLTYCVQALETLKKLEQVNGAVLMTLHKLPSIRGDLVRTDPHWESWDFVKLSEAIRLWVRGNPADIAPRNEREQEQSAKRNTRQTRIYHTHREHPRPRRCVYCGEDHRPTECTKVTNLSDRRQVLLSKRLCFNCAAGNHRASHCPSRSDCQRCHKRHHTSICDAVHPTSDANNSTTVTRGVALTTNQIGESLFPVIVVEVNGIKCPALIDSGAGSSYVSAKLIDLLRLKPIATQTRSIDMLMSTKVATLEEYDLSFRSVNHQFTLPVKATKVNKSELLAIDNPNYRAIINKNPHLRGVVVHVVLGSGEYARIKTENKTTDRTGKHTYRRAHRIWMVYYVAR